MERPKSISRFVLLGCGQAKSTLLCTIAAKAIVAAGPAAADTLKPGVAFNTGIGEKTANQPADGVEGAYQITLKGDLDGTLHRGRRRAALWSRRGRLGHLRHRRRRELRSRRLFSYTSSGAWDGNGFHAAGTIEEGSGSGDFEGLSGRVAQLGGGGADAGDGTFDIPATWCSTRLEAEPPARLAAEEHPPIARREVIEFRTVRRMVERWTGRQPAARSMPRGPASVARDAHGNAHAAADAKRCQSFLGVALDHLM